MPDVLAHWTRLVRQAPDAPALTESATGRTWTRAELDAEALAFPEVKPGQRVTFALPNGARWFHVFIGLIRARAVPVPLDPAEPPASQFALATAARASFAWFEGTPLTPIQSNPIGYSSPESPSAAESKSNPIGYSSPAPPSAAESKSNPIGYSSPAPPPAAEPKSNLLGYSFRSAFLVKLTSGSTGQPKALAFTNAQMLADGRQVCASMGVAPDDVNFAVIPLGHSYGLGNLVMPLLLQGTALVCSGVPLPHVLAADIARWRPTVFPAVPALLRAFAQSDLLADALASLRTVISAGSPLSADIARAFFEKFNLRPHSFYGSSETGGIAYDRTGDATLAGRGVGTPMEGVTLTPVRGGRLRVTSAAVRGRGSFIPADRATFNEHGELVLLGRAGRLAKISGRRLDLGDLERVLRGLPGIRDAFVAMHPQNPDELAAVLATALDAGAVRLLLRRELASWKVPRRVVTVADFPLTARGKPDTRALQALLAR